MVKRKTMRKKKLARGVANKKKTSRTGKHQKMPMSLADPEPKQTILLITDRSHVTGVTDDVTIQRLLPRSSIGPELEARRNELRKQYTAVRSVLKKHRSWLRSLLGVTGMGIQFVTKRGLVVSPLQYVIVVDVRVKRDAPGIARHNSEFIPRELSDDQGRSARVKVVERQYSLSNGTFPIIIGGVAISPQNDISDWGTLGAAIDLAADAGRVLVTCEHVVRGDSEVVQLDDPPEHPPRQELIGTVNTVNKNRDCASIAPKNVAKTRLGVRGAMQGKHLNFLTTKPSPISDLDARFVEFEGALSHSMTNLIISSPDIDRDVDGTTFRNVIEFDAGSGTPVEPGDSGSLLILQRDSDTENERTVVGLVFARWTVVGTHGLAIPFWHVADKLQLSPKRAVTWP